MTYLSSAVSFGHFSLIGEGERSGSVGGKRRDGAGFDY